MKVKPKDLIVLGDDALAASRELDAAWDTSVRGQQLSASTTGNLASGADLLEAHTEVSGAADLAVGLLAGTLEQNMDDLYAVAFDMTTTDEKVAGQFESQYPAPAPPSPGPAPSPSPGPTPTP